MTSRIAVPAVMTSSTTSTRPSSGEPTTSPPSPWSLASLRLKHQGTSRPCRTASCTAVADAIVQSGVDFDVLMGPAYKGIPIAAATAVQLSALHDRDVPWSFNRKEAKDHGEGGLIVGSPLAGRVLVVDDVITAGTAIREVMQILDTTGATCAGIVVAVDRQERGRGELSAIQEVERDFGVPVISIIGFDQIIEFVEETGRHAENLDAIRGYREEFGTGA